MCNYLKKPFKRHTFFFILFMPDLAGLVEIISVKELLAFEW